MTAADDDNLCAARRLVDAFIDEGPLARGDERPCPYLPDRPSCGEGFHLEGQMDGTVYRALMDRGFRRSGRVFYRPACPGCNACIPIRVPVASFLPTKSMRRVWRRNADVRVEAGDGLPTDDKYALFAAYLAGQHDGTMDADRAAFEDFLYDSPVPGREYCYYLGRRLAGVSLLDETPGALSSVYMYFDPQEAARSLGTFSATWELEHCRATGIAYYYLGYWVPGSKTMAYKARFQPAEVYDRDRGWVPFADCGVD